MGLLVMFAAWYTDPAALWGLFQAIFGLGFVIFVHEAGHFLVAKACGVKCEKFYVGFDPPMKLGFGKWAIPLPSSLWKKQWGETEYGIGIIPLGGYVKMLGQDDNPAKYREMQEKALLAKKEQAATGDAPKEASQQDAPSGDSSSSEEDYVLDPRSYMAKSVPKRMAIISAGVIMNLIFAVNFAATAFYFGAPISPTIVHSVAPGTPSWIHDLPLGSKIIQITRDGRKSEYLRHDMDLSQTIALWEQGKEISLLLRLPSGEEKWYTLTPDVVEIEDEGEISQLGIGAAMTLQLAAKNPIPTDVPVPTASASPGFEGSDTIVGVKVDGKLIDTPDYPAFNAQLARLADDEITIVVKREVKKEKSDSADKDQPKEYKNLDIRVGRRARRMSGFYLTMGPVMAVREGSSAAQAGLQKDDLITQVNGQDVVDPLTLPDVLRRLAGQKVTLTVKRGEGDKQETVSLEITPELPPSFASGGSRVEPPVSLEAIGVTILPIDTVASTVPGSEAAEKLQPGDKIIAASFTSDSEETLKLLRSQKYTDEIDLTKIFSNWVSIDSSMQSSPADTKVKLTCLRGEEKLVVELTPTASDEWSLPTRGVILQRAVAIHTATGIGDAYALGLRQTTEDALRVFTFLRKLVTGRVSPKMLGGPITIGVVATSEATRDWRRLLLFLTLLSANLAVINFMPIPVLDGGHMVFLGLEAIFRRPVSEKIVIPLTYLGLFMILGLMLFVFGRDISRFLL